MKLFLDTAKIEEIKEAAALGILDGVTTNPSLVSKEGKDFRRLLDEILKIVKRSKKGVDVPTLKKKTGFDDKKVRNIVFRASKEGKIKKSGRGIYVGA